MEEGFPPAWRPALDGELAKPYFRDLTAFVASERERAEVLPGEGEVFAALAHTPPDRVRAVILGQDPYPTPGHAHGLCFSVRPGVALPASLRNIYKELQADLGIASAKHGSLLAWADRGVLLLNAVLTVRAGEPNSHKGRGWETFTDAVLDAVNSGPRRIAFVLWGAYAQKKAARLDSTWHALIASAHPSPLSAKAGFFGSKPFSKVNAALEQFGEPPLDWQLPATA